MRLFIIFFAVTCISFLGSVHPGPVNLSVIHTALLRGRKPALLLALGGSLPEIFYASVALFGLRFLEQYPHFFQVFRWAVVPVLGIMGLVLLLSKSKDFQEDASPSVNYDSFAKGLTLSFLNPQILPYWLAFSISFQSSEWLRVETLAHQLAFVLGTAVGAYLLNALYAYVAYTQRKSILAFFNVKLIDKFVGASLLAMAAWQLFRLVWE